MDEKNPGFIIMDTDENLRPAIMEREKYIHIVLTEHLLNKNKTYLQISKERAKEILDNFAKELHNLISFDHGRDIDDDLKVYFLMDLSKWRGYCNLWHSKGS